MSKKMFKTTTRIYKLLLGILFVSAFCSNLQAEELIPDSFALLNLNSVEYKGKLFFLPMTESTEMSYGQQMAR